MLDFNKLLPQFDSISTDDLQEEKADRLALAKTTMTEACANAAYFQQRLTDAKTAACTFWSLASPLETIDTVIPLAVSRHATTVVAVDGSQIMPSHHEVHNCYLINIGRTVISYGAQHPVILDSAPHLFHNAEDLYPLVNKRRLHVDELFVSLERHLLELSTLRDTAIEVCQRALPVVALTDGSLAAWSLERMPESYQKQYGKRLRLLLDTFIHHRIPLLGYISQSRSSEIINMLRVWKCPYTQSDCHRQCGQLTEDEYPCSVLWPIHDRQLMQETLPAFVRGPLFISGSSQYMDLPLEYAICFTFVNVGKEVARIEFPRWLAEDIPLLHRAIETAISQAEKGSGYPLSLAEAHNQAVIRSHDRKRFFDLLANHLIELGIPKVRVSPKESGKRKGIV